MTRGPRRGASTQICQFLGFDFSGFWPFLGDLEPKKRPDLGGKLGFDSQLKIL
jgi:hypothetical protein